MNEITEPFEEDLELDRTAADMVATSYHAAADDLRVSGKGVLADLFETLADILRSYLDNDWRDFNDAPLDHVRMQFRLTPRGAMCSLDFTVDAVLRDAA